MIKRDIENKILKYAKEYPVISLIGPRQSGKTTLVKKIFAKMDYVNLEDLEKREFAQNDPKGFLAQYKKSVIIDEVQRVPELFSYIQVIVDEKKKNGLFVLTGSQNFLLMEKISQSLAGRVALFKLFPLALSELELKKNKDVDDFLYKGFYPKLYSQKIGIDFYYDNYIQTYIERDVRQLKNINNLSTFKKFLNLCAARVGQLLNVSSLADDCGINHKTANEWLSVLEMSFIIYSLRPYHKNYNKRVVKMSKLYFYDSGLLCSLLGINDKKQLANHYLRGGIFESFVIGEFLKNKYNNNFKNELYFWRDKLGNEVDLLIENQKGIFPIEIKSGQTVSSDYFKGLQYYYKVSEREAKESSVIYAGNDEQKRTYANVFSWRSLFNDNFFDLML